MRRYLKERGSESTQIAIAIAVGSAIAIGIYTGLAPHIKDIVDKIISSLTG
ncbi:MAG: hypothetical protein H0Z39_07030 [Peptococcaceae bacterium]|nr:hypothetical protein [Peptococcaceae bacterium]